MKPTYTTRCCCWSLVLVGLTLATAKAENWPRFRGPTGDGISTETGLPVEWNGTDHVAWRTPIPGEGWSSPIIWGERVFLTATLQDGRKCHVLCLDAASGRILWNTDVLAQVPGHKESKNSYATPTPCTDGERVYAVFADGSVAALDFTGRVLWTNREVSFYSRHGLGASPLLYDGLFIMPYDGSMPRGPSRPVSEQHEGGTDGLADCLGPSVDRGLGYPYGPAGMDGQTRHVEDRSCHAEHFA